MIQRVTLICYFKGL